MARSCPDSLCMALNTAPYALKGIATHITTTHTPRLQNPSHQGLPTLHQSFLVNRRLLRVPSSSSPRSVSPAVAACSCLPWLYRDARVDSSDSNSLTDSPTGFTRTFRIGLCTHVLSTQISYDSHVTSY